MAKMGRPKSPLEKRVMIRLSEQELQDMERYAASIGLTLSAYLRMAGLEKMRRRDATR